MSEATYIELLPATQLSTGYEMSKREAMDCGAYKTLEVQFEVLTAGSGTGGEAVVLQHSSLRDGEYLDISGTGIAIDSTAVSAYQHVSSFLRYVRVKVNGTVAGSPVVAIRVIAKD